MRFRNNICHEHRQTWIEMSYLVDKHWNQKNNLCASLLRSLSSWNMLPFFYNVSILLTFDSFWERGQEENQVHLSNGFPQAQKDSLWLHNNLLYQEFIILRNCYILDNRSNPTSLNGIEHSATASLARGFKMFQPTIKKKKKFHRKYSFLLKSVD